MAVVEPDLRLAREVRQQRLVEQGFPGFLANQPQAGGEQISIHRVGRVAGQQALQMRDRLGGLLLAKQGLGIGEARAGLIGGQVEGMDQQYLGVRVAALGAKHLAQHLSGGRVVRVAADVLAQQALGLLRPAGEQGFGGRTQRRIAHGGAGVLGEGLLGAREVAGREQPLAQGAPRFG